MKYWGRRVVGISGSLIWSKTLMELIRNLYGEFRWIPKSLVRRIHSPHLHVGTISFKVCSDAKESGVRKATGSYRTYWVLGKTAALVPEFAVEDLPSAELQPTVGSCVCSEGLVLGQNTLMMTMCSNYYALRIAVYSFINICLFFVGLLFLFTSFIY